MRRLSACAAVCALAAGLAAPLSGVSSPARNGAEAPPAFTRLGSVAPSIGQEIRYATEHNFVGEVIDGYREPVCLLTRDAALALRRAQRALAPRGYGLLVYDCYRPRRAVEHFLRWARDPRPSRTRAEFHPRIPKDRLFAAGYLAERSGHSRGSTVDLTLVRRGSGERGGAVDMGTPFDCFDPRSHHPGAAGIGTRQRAARQLLRETLAAEGFVPVANEWWHFTYAQEPFPGTYFDFPVSRAVLSGRGGQETAAAAGPPP